MLTMAPYANDRATGFKTPWLRARSPPVLLLTNIPVAKKDTRTVESRVPEAIRACRCKTYRGYC